MNLFVPLKYKDAQGKVKNYTATDLKYDLRTKALRYAEPQGDASDRASLFALALTDSSGHISAEEVLHIRTYRHLFGDCEIHIEVDQPDGSPTTYLIRKSNSTAFPAGKIRR